MFDQILNIQVYFKSPDLECQRQSHPNKEKYYLLCTERTISVDKTFRRWPKEVHDVFWTSYAEVDSGRREGRRGCAPPLFLQSLVFSFNQFEELQIVLFEVELIINDAPLTYVYRNTIKTCLTPNHLLFGTQLLFF